MSDHDEFDDLAYNPSYDDEWPLAVSKAAHHVATIIHRHRRHQTDAQLADYLGVSHDEFAEIVRGWKEPDLTTIMRLPGVLGITADEALGMTSTPAPFKPGRLGASHAATHNLACLSRFIAADVQQAGLSAVAQRADVSIGAVRQAMLGYNISAITIAKLAAAFGLDFYVGPWRDNEMADDDYVTIDRLRRENHLLRRALSQVRDCAETAREAVGRERYSDP